MSMDYYVFAVEPQAHFFKENYDNMDMLEKVKEIVASQLRLEASEIADDASIVEDLGADSLDLVDIVMAFENEFDTEVSEDDLPELRTIRDLADYISGKAE